MTIVVTHAAASPCVLSHVEEHRRKHNKNININYALELIQIECDKLYVYTYVFVGKVVVGRKEKTSCDAFFAMENFCICHLGTFIPNVPLFRFV